jgi:hypothetical protein
MKAELKVFSCQRFIDGGAAVDGFGQPKQALVEAEHDLDVATEEVKEKLHVVVV